MSNDFMAYMKQSVDEERQSQSVKEMAAVEGVAKSWEYLRTNCPNGFKRLTGTQSPHCRDD